MGLRICFLLYLERILIDRGRNEPLAEILRVYIMTDQKSWRNLDVFLDHFLDLCFVNLGHQRR